MEATISWLIYADRERLERHFLVLLNTPRVANASSPRTTSRFRASGGLPVPAPLGWHRCRGVASFPGPVVVKPSNKEGWSDSQLRKRVRKAKALVFPSGAKQRPIPCSPFHQLTCQQYAPATTAPLVVPCVRGQQGTCDPQLHGTQDQDLPPTTARAPTSSSPRTRSFECWARLAACILKGIFKMDFKQDAGTGAGTARGQRAFNLWHYLGAANGGTS